MRCHKMANKQDRVKQWDRLKQIGSQINQLRKTALSPHFFAYMIIFLN